MRIQDLHPTVQKNFSLAIEFAKVAIAQRQREIDNLNRFIAAASACVADEALPRTEVEAEGQRLIGSSGNGGGLASGNGGGPMSRGDTLRSAMTSADRSAAAEAGVESVAAALKKP